MGWAERARRAEEQLESHRYRVRLWTNFAAQSLHKDEEIAVEQVQRRKARFEMAADVYGRNLRKRIPDAEATVKLVSVKKEPQIMFEMFVTAVNPDAAIRRALYHAKRALDVGIHMGAISRLGRPIRTKLTPPWGRCEAELSDQLKSRRKRKAVAADG